MTMDKAFFARVETIIGSSYKKRQGIELRIACKTVDDAKQQLVTIRQMQKELRLVKKELGYAKRTIRSSYTTAKVKIGKGFRNGLIRSRSVDRANALRRNQVRIKERQALVPFESVERLIDSLLVQMDHAKSQ